MRQLKLHRNEFDPKMNPPYRFNYWIEDDGITIWREYTNYDFVAVHIDMKRAVDGNFEPIGDKLYPMPRTKFRSYADIGGTAEILATLDSVLVCTDGSVQLVDVMGIIRDTTEVLASCEAQSLVNEDDFIGVPI